MAETASQQFSGRLLICCQPGSPTSPTAEASNCGGPRERGDKESHGPLDISALYNYVHLKRLELPYNNIKDLSCISHMPYLVLLDASHNEISTFFEFEPPKNLQEVNLSHNRIAEMKDLAGYASLCKLNLDYNKLSEVTGLQQCCRLTHLSVAHNRISRIRSLDGLPLTHLCLRGNQLERIEGLENVKCLQVLDLSLNHITSLTGLQNLHILCSVDLEKNQINEIEECKHIHELSLLRDLNLLENPVQNQPDYRLAVIFLLQHLTVLDREEIAAEEKVVTVNKYDPSLDLVAARDHMTQLVHQLMQPQILYDSTPISADSPYPVIVLTGPQGCGKRELAHRLCQDFSEYFGYGICHTTRRPYCGEKDGIDYHFVSEEDFQRTIYMGKFIQSMRYGGHRFGLTRDVIDDLAREGLACCLHMELEGIFGLKKSHLEPRYILLIPAQVEKYIGQLKSCGLYTPAQIDVAVSRIDLYASTNKQQMRFFDDVIHCDDLEEAYQTLQHIVKDFLLLDEEEEEDDNNSSNPSLESTSTGNDPEEKRPSPLLGSGSLISDSVSAVKPSESSYRPYLTKIYTDLSPEKYSAELASVKRREQLVREAIVGRSPGVYSQLFKSPTQTAQLSPSSLDNQDPGGSQEMSSSSDSRASSALSFPISAGALVEPLDMPVMEHTLGTVKDHTASGQTSDGLHPTADHLPVIESPPSDGRPLFNIKLVLPPIPDRRKTSASPSSSESPKLSPSQPL
ncbi:leucine-rich repeat and guanylate kinase domain-containing protein [Menidia menidia]